MSGKRRRGRSEERTGRGKERGISQEEGRLTGDDESVKHAQCQLNDANGESEEMG